MSFNINKQLNAEELEPKAAESADAGETVEATATPNKPAYEPIVETAHDDFDWSRDKRNVSSYSAEEKAKYDDVYDNTFKQINDGEMIQALFL